MAASTLVNSILMALFISIICAQPIAWLQRKRVPQWLAIVIVFVGIIAIFSVLGDVVGRSVSSFVKQAPQYELSLDQIEISVQDFLDENGLGIVAGDAADLLDPGQVMGYTSGLLGQVGSFMGNTLTIMFLVLFLLMEMDSVNLKAQAILKGSSASIDYLSTIGQSIRHYLSIKTFTSLLTGGIIWLALLLIGLDYAILWGLIAFLLNYIPNIGSILAAVPAVLFAMVQFGFGGALGVTAVFLSVNMIVGNLIEPKVMGQGLGLSTFVVFFSLIFWGFVLGSVGMFLSVPLTIAIKIMLEQNPSTRGIAIALGTQEEAQMILDSEDK